MKEKIFNMLKQWLAETPAETAERKALIKGTLKKAHTGRKLIMLTSIVLALESVALWAMTSTEAMRECYGAFFQRLRPHAAAWADFAPRLVVLCLMLLVTALAAYSLFELQDMLKLGKETKMSGFLEKAIQNLTGISTWLMLFTAAATLLVSIADASISKAALLLETVLHPGEVLLWLLLLAAVIASAIYFSYTAAVTMMQIARELPGMFEAFKFKKNGEA